jgi:hypothetical protein
MAKRFLYLAMVAFVATAFIACGSDDDDGGGSSGGSGKQTVTIQPAKFAQKAGKYNFTEGLKANQNNIEMTTLEIMDGGQVSFELLNKETGKKDVVVADVEMRDNIGYIKENLRVNGTFKLIQGTKAINANQIELNVYIDGNAYIAEEGSPAACVLQAVLESKGEILNYIAQKFQIRSMIIDLKGDVKAFKTISSANLAEIAKIAQDNGANLTSEELKSFQKVISYVSISRYGTIDIVYSDGKCDSGTWNWLNNQADQMNLWLKDKGMGNKFIPENTSVDIDFSGKECALKIHAKITGSKNYDASLTLVMMVVE